MKKTLLALGSLVGLAIAGTANLQLTIGVAIMVICYLELRKLGVNVDQIDDIVLEQIKKFKDAQLES